MASVQLLPAYSRISRKILRLAAPADGARAFEVVRGLDRLWMSLRCPLHQWSWPRSNREERLGGYDAHQTCHKCTARRMFDSRLWRPGPVFRNRVRRPSGGDARRAWNSPLVQARPAGWGE